MYRARVDNDIVRFNVLYGIPHNWGLADREIAERHINDYGVVFIDENDMPIENEYTTDCIEEHFRKMEEKREELAEFFPEEEEPYNENYY